MSCLIDDGFSISTDANETLALVPDFSPVKLQIGNIRDIAVAVPIDDFLNLNLPHKLKLRFPMNEPPLMPSNYDRIVELTKEQMKDYRTSIVKPAYRIENNTITLLSLRF